MGLHHALGTQQLLEVRRDVVFELETCAKRRGDPNIVWELGRVLTMVDKRLGRQAPDTLQARQRVYLNRGQ